MVQIQQVGSRAAGTREPCSSVRGSADEHGRRQGQLVERMWLFAGSERGGRAAATIYTLIESCRRVDVDPFLYLRYLRDVLVRVCTHPASRVHELVPAVWKDLSAADAAR